jgi:hypothetical protein
MDEVKINTSKSVSIDLGQDPDDNVVTVYLYHEFGDLILGPEVATRNSSGKYSYLIAEDLAGDFCLNSSGKYRVDFTYSLSGISGARSAYFNVYTPYTNPNQFFEQYPELEDVNGSKFDLIERRARAVINTYCGQTFDPYINKKLIVNGNNHNVLHLPLPIAKLKTVTLNEGEVDETLFFDESQNIKNIEKVRQPFNFSSTYYIRFKRGAPGITQRILESSNFKEESSYSIVGDWGWPYVPDNVFQAANLLIADMMNDDSEYRKHGIVSVDMDNIRFSMKPSFYESTGNIEADVLLIDYTLFVMDYIV